MKLKILLLSLISSLAIAGPYYLDMKLGTSGTINSKAVLDMASTTKGALLPRMTTVQRGNIATPPEGLLVFDTDLNGICQYDGAAWQCLYTVTIGTYDSQTIAANGLVASGFTVYAQSADATHPGMVSTGTQTFGGTKTFSNVNTSGVYQSGGSTFVSNPGTGNTFLGISAGAGNSGTFSTCVGNLACDASMSSGLNVGIGTNALGAVTSGNQNTAVGVNACTSSTTEQNVTCIGYGSNVAAGRSNALSLGANSTVDRSNSINLGGSTINLGVAGVNSGAPTARVHIPAGTTTAETAPLKIEGGSNLTAAEAGAIENNGTDLYYTNNVPTRKILISSTTGVADITQGGTGQATAVAGFDALAPTTTKGDLIVSDGSDNIRLAKGTDDYVLTADAGETSGLKWAPASTGGGNYQPGSNLIENNSWEVDTSGWTDTGLSYTRSTGAGNVVDPGLGSAALDASATDQTLVSTSVTVNSFINRAGVFSCEFQTTATDYLMQVLAGSTVISSSTIAASGGWSRQTVFFPFGGDSAANITAQFKSQSNAAVMRVDNCFLGTAEDFALVGVGQATMFGSVKSAATASCQWTRTSASYGSYSADADCPTATATGNASAPSTKIPAITFNNMPPGEYLFIVNASFEQNSNANYGAWKLTDGTNDIAEASLYSTGTSLFVSGVLQGTINYTTAGTRTIEIQCKQNGVSACDINVTAIPFKITVYRFPTTTETAYRPDQLANSWMGMHEDDCSWARTDTALGDPTADAACTFTEKINNNFGTVTSALSGGDKLPGITFTPTRVGTYELCAQFAAEKSATADSSDLRMWDGTTTIINQGYESTTTSGENRKHKILCGMYKATSIAAKTITIQTAAGSGSITIFPSGANADSEHSTILWTIKQIDQGFPMPLLSCEENTVWYYGGAGEGSTDVATREYSTQGRYVGTAMTPTNNSTNGLKVTVVRAGVYNISIIDGDASAGNIFGITRNAADPTGTINSEAVGAVLVYALTQNAGSSQSEHWSGWLNAGDIIRVQTEAANSLDNTTDRQVQFRMTKDCL